MGRGLTLHTSLGLTGQHVFQWATVAAVSEQGPLGGASDAEPLRRRRCFHAQV